MKIAFSTLGCPDFDWPDIYSMAKDLGFDGIEMRGLGDDLFAVNARPFRADQIDKTIALLARMHLTIPCLSSGCVLKDTENWPATREEIGDYIRLAARLGSSYIRLLADRNADREGEVDDEVVLAHLKEVLPLAEEKGVMLLLETNGVYADTARLRDLLVRAEDAARINRIVERHSIALPEQDGRQNPTRGRAASPPDREKGSQENTSRAPLSSRGSESSSERPSLLDRLDELGQEQRKRQQNTKRRSRTERSMRER